MIVGRNENVGKASACGGLQPARRERGFALLLVFLMAATIAITLYWQIPRVAFQSQRQKEQLLIERGEQYQRAIQLFVRANNRYPAKLEDLENFNNRRFLRHKFKDPMTGKDEWRLVHVNAAGVFTDSIANKKKAQPDAPASQNTFVGTDAFLAPDPSQQTQQGPTAANRRRQSEGGAAPVDANGQPLIPPPNAQAQNVVPPPFPQPGGQLGIPGNPQPGFPGQPGQDPNNPQLTNQQPNQFPNQAMLQGQPGQPGFSGGNPNAPYPGAAVSPDAVNNLNNAQNNSNSVQQASAQSPVIPQQPPFPQPGAGAFRQPGGFPQPGVTQNPSQPGAAQNSTNSSSSSFVGGGSSFVGGSSSFVGGDSFVGSSTAPPTPANPNSFAQPGNNGQPGTQPGLSQPPFPQPGLNQPAAQQGFPPQSFPQQNVSQPAQNPGFAQPGQSNTATNAGVPGFQANPGAQNAAANMINNILTGPRQGGVAGTQSTPQGQQIGAGIAGVASTSEAPAIMEYNQNTHYNEWEFIFDISKQKQTANPNGVPGTPAQALGTTPGATPGTPVATAAQPGGATVTASAFGTPGQSSSPFGTTPGTATTSGTATGTSGQQTTPGGAPVQQQSPIPTWFRFGQP